MVLHGENLIITLGGTAIAASKSCTVEMDAEIIKVSDSTDGAWEHHVVGRKSWKVTTNHLVQNFVDMLPRVGQSYTLALRLNDSDGGAFPVDDVILFTPAVESGVRYKVSTDSIVYSANSKCFYLLTGNGKYYSQWIGGTINYTKYTSPQDGYMYDVTLANRHTIRMWLNGELVNMNMGGTATCKSCRITATKGNLMQGSFVFEGNGALT